MNIHPLGNRVLVERLKTTDIIGGIYIPEMAKEKANVAKVLAVGPGKLIAAPYIAERKSDRLQVAIKAGDRVIFGKYSGVDFEHEGKTLLFLREDEIFAILLDNVSVVK